jgi:hypothetical protein
MMVNTFNNHIYEDNFSDSMSGFEPSSQSSNLKVEPGVPESPSIEKGHKILQFTSPPSLNCHMLDYAARPALVSMTSQLHGMFFLAESAFPGTEISGSTIKDLTCYRRNLFQVTGSMNLSKGIRFVVLDGGKRQIPITALEATISATETVDHNPVKLICVPWKSPGNGSAEDKAEKEPESLSIDLSAGSDDPHADFIHVPIAWKRLQFRIATANNGRRKELQQHFVLHLKLVATIADGRKVEVAQIHSNSIVVRGRSPRNFQARNDLPISGSVGRRTLHVSRHSTGDARLPSSRASKPERLDLPQKMDRSFSFQVGSANGSLTPSPSFHEWNMPAIKQEVEQSPPAHLNYPVINVATPPEDLFTFSAQGSPPLSDLELAIPTNIMRPASAPLRRPGSSAGASPGMPRSAPRNSSKSPMLSGDGDMSPMKRARTGETPPPVTMGMLPMTTAGSILAPHALAAGQNIPFMVMDHNNSPIYPASAIDMDAPLFSDSFSYDFPHSAVSDGMYWSQQTVNMPPVTHVNPEFISVTSAPMRAHASKRSFSDGQ